MDFLIPGRSENQAGTGISFGFLFSGANVTEEMKAAPFGLFNWNSGTTHGLNLAAINITIQVNSLNWNAANDCEAYTKADLGWPVSRIKQTSSWLSLT